MSNVYTVNVDGREGFSIHVEAKSKGEARKVALSHVTVKRLTGSEILELSRKGSAILSADAEEIIGAEADA